jgi:putative ABC transport system permease protein
MSQRVLFRWFPSESHFTPSPESAARRRDQLRKVRRAALVAFGGMTQVAEQCRDQRGTRWVEDLTRDVAFSARQFRKFPGFFLTAGVTLAIGIGATTAMFSAVYGVLLRPLPYSKPDQLAAISCTGASRGGPRMGCALPDLREIASRNRSFTEFASYYYREFNLTSGTPERVPGQSVTASLFPLLGVRPALGERFRSRRSSSVGARWWF